MPLRTSDILEGIQERFCLHTAEIAPLKSTFLCFSTPAAILHQATLTDRPRRGPRALAAVEAEIRGLRAILEPIKSQCWLFLCVLLKQRWGGRNDSDWSIFEDHCWRRDAVVEFWFTPCAG
jgi:hypothetical protein